MSGTKRRCTTASMYLPLPGGGSEKVSLSSVSLWGLDPATDRPVRIRTWKDLRDLEGRGTRSGQFWDHSVLVGDAHMTADAAARSLRSQNPPQGARTVYLDADTARGRDKAPWTTLRQTDTFGDAFDGVTIAGGAVQIGQVDKERLAALQWLATTTTTRGADELRRRGIAQLARTLFGDACRRDIVRACGDALLVRGPTRRIGSRHTNVAFAGMVAPWLTPDQIADILGWPWAPTLETNEAMVMAFGCLLEPLSERDRHLLCESLAVDLLSGSSGHYRNDYDDYNDYAEYQEYYEEVLGVDRVEVELALEKYAPGASAALGINGPHAYYLLDNDELVLATGALAAIARASGIETPGNLSSFNAYYTELCLRVLPDGRGFAWPEPWADLAGVELSRWPGAKLVVPGGPQELDSWGREMGNCIGGYAGSVTGGEVLIAGVEVEGRLVANVSVCLEESGYVIEDIRGRYNAELPEHDVVKEVISATLGRVGDARARATKGCSPIAGWSWGTDDTAAPDDNLLPHEAVAEDAYARLERTQRRGGRRGRRVVPARRDEQRYDPAAVVRALAEPAATLVPDELAGAVAVGSIGEGEARRLVGHAASAGHSPMLRDVVALVAEVDPTCAHLRPDAADRARDLLIRAAGGEDIWQEWEELDPLATPDDDARHVVARVLRLWSEQTATEAVAAEAWRRGMSFMVDTDQGSLNVVINEDGEPVMVGARYPLQDHLARSVRRTLGIDRRA